MTADADKVTLRYRAESTYGTAPGGTYQELRYTGEGLKKTTDTTRSQEIEDDRQIKNIIRTNAGAAGPINFELSYGTYDELLASLLGSAGWSTAQTNAASSISFAAASGGTQVISDLANGFSSFLANQWVQIYGAANSANNGIFKMSAAAAGSITVYNADGVVEAAGASVTCIMGSQITNGVTLTSFSFEKEFTDVSNVFELLTGCVPDTGTLDVSPTNILTGNFGILGQDDVGASSSDAAGNTARTTTESLNAVDHVYAVLENNAVYGVTQVGWSYANNLRGRMQVGTLGPISIGMGTINVSGTHRAYFANNTVMDKYRNQTVSSVAFVLQDTAGSQGNAYVFDWPSVKYTDGQTVATGQNQDVLADMSWDAFKDATEDITMRIVRFPSVA